MVKTGPPIRDSKLRLSHINSQEFFLKNLSVIKRETKSFPYGVRPLRSTGLTLHV